MVVYTPLVSAPWSQREMNFYDVEVSLVDIESSKPARFTE